MGNGPCIPLRRSNREAAGLEGDETLSVTIELDSEKREIKPPPDFVRALKGKPPAWDRWRELSYTHQREHVEAIEEAKTPETRARRIDGAVRMIASRPPRQARSGKMASASSRPRLKAAWHDNHPMPRNPTTEQRLAWHQAHEKNCGCRPMPAKLRALTR
jgi:hypothetical protein